MNTPKVIVWPQTWNIAYKSYGLLFLFFVLEHDRQGHCELLLNGTYLGELFL